MPLGKNTEEFVPLDEIPSVFSTMEWNGMHLQPSQSLTNTSLDDVQVQVDFSVTTPWPPPRHPATPCPSLRGFPITDTNTYGTLVSVSSNDTDAASFKTVTTIDGLFDDNNLTHPCTINPSHVSPCLITYPAPTYQPNGISPPLPHLPDNINPQRRVLSHWLQRELDALESQQEHNLERTTSTNGNQLRVRLTVMAMVFASLVTLIVLSNVYEHTYELHQVLVGIGTGFVGLFIISMVNVFIEVARRSSQGRVRGI